MAKVTISGIDKLIIINDNITSIDIKVDVYSEWKRWCILSDNLKYDKAFNVIGGEPITQITKLGTTLFLLNNWKIRPFEGNHILHVTGNLYCDDGTSPYIQTIHEHNVQIISTVSSLIETPIVNVTGGDGGSTYNPYSNLYNVVYIDINSTSSGVTYPTGTKEYPVNNMIDAMSIAVANGIEIIKIVSAITLSNNINGFTIIGDGHNVITLNNTNVNNSKFENCILTGSVNGILIAKYCTLTNISIYNVEMHSCKLSNDIVFNGTDINCMSSYAINQTNNIAVMYINSTLPTVINIISFNGYINIINTNINASIHANFIGGMCMVDSISVAGIYNVTGIVNLINNTQIPINTSNILNPHTISSNVLNYDMNAINENNTKSLGMFIKYNLLTVLKFIGMK